MIQVFKINRTEYVLAPDMDSAISAWKKQIGEKYKTMHLQSIEFVCIISIDWYKLTEKELNKY